MRTSTGDFYLVDPDPFAPTPTVPTSGNICLDIHNNVQLSPKLCLWAINQKLEPTGEHSPPGQFAEFCHLELSEYVESRAEVDDSFCKHLVINTLSRTFEDANYVNTIGSKVVIKPVGEIMELSLKKEKILQRTMVIPQYEKGSSAEDPTGGLPSGEIPEASEASASGYLALGETPEVPTASASGDLSGEIPFVSLASVTEDLPSGEISGSQGAEPTEDLPPGKISVEEAKEEDVEMEEPKEEEEEVPQHEQMQDAGEVDYAESSVSSEAMQRAYELVNSNVNDAITREEDPNEPLEPRPRVANRVQAGFLKHWFEYELGRIDNTFQQDRQRRQETHQQQCEAERRHEQHQQDDMEEEPAVPSAEEGVKIYQDELECRKNMDIFAQPSSAEFLKLQHKITKY